jgi:hypothetical protein
MVVFTPAQLLERLSQRLDLLGGRQGGDARQETLRAASPGATTLDPAEQQLFRRLGVFAVAAASTRPRRSRTQTSTLQSLLDKSLRRRDNTVRPRFWMLETIHEYALERLRKRQADVIDTATPNGSSRWASSDWPEWPWRLTRCVARSELGDIRSALGFDSRG